MDPSLDRRPADESHPSNPGEVVDLLRDVDFRILSDAAPALVWVCSACGENVLFNARWYEYTGQTPEEASGYGWASAMHPEDAEGILPYWKRCQTTGEPYEGEVRYRRQDGAYRWHVFRALPRRHPDGTIERWYGVSVDVQARKEAEAALRLANEALEARVAERTRELEEALRESEAFSYSVAHDLRTPLRAIVATASILLEETETELTPEHRELLVRQARNAGRLGTLIDALLNLSRLARADVRCLPLDVTRKAREVVEEVGCEGSLRFDVQEGMTAEGDPDLVRTLLRSLIENACKFSPEGGRVRVRQEGGVFSVSDEGVGFDAAHAHKLFRPFERMVREDEFPGTGIGLANVERIVRRHGGRVWAESRGLNRGATFFFTLGREEAKAA